MPPTKLDARLTALTRLPPEVVADMLARDRRPTTRLAGPLLTPVRLLPPPPPPPEIRALHGVRAEADGEVVTSVLIRFQGEAARLSEAGARVRSVLGDVATAEATLDVVRALERHPEVVFLELAQPLVPLVDTSLPAMGVDRLHHGTPALRGAGVVVGVVDLDGLDLHHPDFSQPGSDPRRTRLACLWDQTADGGVAPSLWGYGVEYDRAALDEDLDGERPYRRVRARPSGGHGTHVTGIAAGNGRASQGRYTGVAPEADLVFVNLRSDPDHGIGETPALCDALAYVFARASGRPCVVNVSLGTQSGPRDGSSNLERAVDHLVATPGRAVVAAAGNEGERGRHKQGTVPREGGAILELRVPDRATHPEVIEIWYPGEARFDVTVVTPAGVRLGPVGPSSEVSSTVDRLRVTVVSTLQDARNGDNCIEILLQPAENAVIPRGTWKLVLERGHGAPDGAYHATFTSGVGIVWCEPSPRFALASPGTSRGAVTVGNYLHCAGGVLSSTSSRGPTRDGREKPDLAAPGTAITSARWDARSAAPEEAYMLSTGTSMAAPHVTGLIALLFERHGAVDTETLKAMLREHADRRGLPEGWDPAWGWGRARAPPPREGVRERDGARAAVTPEPVRGQGNGDGNITRGGRSR